MSYARKNLYANPATLYGEIPQGDEVEPVPGWGMNPAWAGPRMVGVGAVESASWFRMLERFPVITESGLKEFLAYAEENSPAVIEAIRRKKQSVVAGKNPNGSWFAVTGDNFLLNLKTFPKEYPGLAVVSTGPGPLDDAIRALRIQAGEKDPLESVGAGTGVSKATMALGTLGVLGVVALIVANARRGSTQE